MRRTLSELEFVAADPSENPFSKIATTTGDSSYFITLNRSSKYTFELNRANVADVENPVENVENLGMCTSLSSVAKIRGFNGSRYTKILYDEFIPEKHVAKINNEFSALANAYETINSNRELNNEKPVELWLLANSNNLGSPILEGFGLTDKIEHMQRRGQEFSILPDRGILIVLAMDSPISKKKRKTALYKAIPDSNFTKMSLENKFSYDSDDHIQTFNLKEFRPHCTIGNLTFLTHKGGERVYVIDKALSAPVNFDDSEIGWTQLKLFFPALYFYYIDGDLFFQNFSVKQKVLTTLRY